MIIVIDDAADVPAHWFDEFNIVSIPVNVHFGEEQFLTGKEFSLDDFYRKAENVTNENWPKTSQPSPYQFEQFYRKLMAEGENEILTITVGEKLSGTYASAIAAKNEIGDEANITVFSSESASAAQGYMAKEAARLAQKGASLSDVLARLEDMREKQVIALIINSLEWAVKGGRVSGIRSTMASLLNIKPIMHLKDGEVVEAGKVRTHSKALRFMSTFVKDRVGDAPVKLATLHANASDQAEQVAQFVEPMFNVVESTVVDLCVPVAINLGPGTVGLIAMPHYDD